MGTYLTDAGFIKKRQDDIIAEIEDGYKTIYGSSVNLEPETTNAQEIALYSESLADIWDLLEVLYHLGDPGASRGRIQELLYAINGITKNQGSKSKVTLLVSGTDGTPVDINFKAATVEGLVFQITQTGTISGGSVSLTAECTELGSFPALAGTITQIVSPQPGITSVTNPLDAEPGKDKETDTEFRLRRTLSTALPGLNILENLYAQLADLSDVKEVKIYQNRTNVIDPQGLDPHSFMPIVRGGTDEDIAKIVWLNTTGGIGSVGDVTVPIIDPNGFTVYVKFQRPDEVDIYIDITLDKFSSYPPEGDTEIRENILDFVNGFLAEETGGFAGFNIGQTIYLSRLYQPVNLVQGHNISDFKIGLSFGSLDYLDISLLFDQLGIFDSTRIRINGLLP